LVTGDEIDHAADLRLTTTVDGAVMQDARTSDLVFGPAELVAYVSSVTRLQPGDIIMSGTPGGVGASRTPPRFLDAGSVVEVTLEGVATFGALDPDRAVQRMDFAAVDRFIVGDGPVRLDLPVGFLAVENDHIAAFDLQARLD